MPFIENLNAKIRLDRLVQQVLSTMIETPGQRRLDKELTKKLLEATDLEYRRVRDLDLYERPLEGETREVLVFDNELAIYHTTVDDVAHWAGISPEKCRQVINHFINQRRVELFPDHIVVRNINDFARFVKSRRRHQE